MIDEGPVLTQLFALVCSPPAPEEIVKNIFNFAERFYTQLRVLMQ